MLVLILLLIGIIGLILGAQLIIKGALNIAEHFKLSHIFIGLTILAIGTDLPELVIDINAAIHRLSGIETSSLIIGETVGTCMAQLALTLGIIGLFGTSLFLTKREIFREGSMLLGSVVLLFLLGFDGELSRLDGLIFVVIYGIYFVLLYGAEKAKELEVKRAPSLDKGWAILSLIMGFGILIFASTLVIDNALELATTWGIKQSFVGAVIVGLGTSLPEITISISALARKAPRLSVGNLIGSNIFDVLFTLGVGSSISGFAVDKDLLFFDIPFLFITSVIVVILFLTNKKLTKKEAVILLVIYFIYLFSKILSIENGVVESFI
ncbi:sodium:calcium antiporter [Patescibacteria group bacterium]